MARPPPGTALAAPERAGRAPPLSARRPWNSGGPSPPAPSSVPFASRRGAQEAERELWRVRDHRSPLDVRTDSIGLATELPSVGGSPRRPRQDLPQVMRPTVTCESARMTVRRMREAGRGGRRAWLGADPAQNNVALPARHAASAAASAQEASLPASADKGAAGEGRKAMGTRWGHGQDQGLGGRHLPDHQGHQRDRLPDETPRPQRRGGGRARARPDAASRSLPRRSLRWRSARRRPRARRSTSSVSP